MEFFLFSILSLKVNDAVKCAYLQKSSRISHTNIIALIQRGVMLHYFISCKPDKFTQKST